MYLLKVSYEIWVITGLYDLHIDFHDTLPKSSVLIDIICR